MNEKRLKQVKKGISDRIASILEEKGWRQQELVNRMDAPKSAISRIMSGEANLTIKTIVEIEGVLGKKILEI